MPTYDYACDFCGETHEFFHAMSAPPVEVCPSCGKKKLRRLIGAGAGIIFKGSGFYQTDYKNREVKLPDAKTSLKDRTKQMEKLT